MVITGAVVTNGHKGGQNGHQGDQKWAYGWSKKGHIGGQKWSYRWSKMVINDVKNGHGWCLKWS